jgi:penicillin-binding protein 1A
MAPARRRLAADAVIGACFFLAIVGGVGIGLAIAATRNAEALGSLGTYRPALPTQVLDRHGNLITQFFSDEKRELVSLAEMPQHLIDALLTREDRNFFRHNGWDPIGLAKALVGHFLLGRPLRGASTITQQLAGWTYANRQQDNTVGRKIRELWWAFQMERRMSKEEILEQYLNEMPLGHNTSGVETASQFYFAKSVRSVTLAESALLVVIYANPSLYSPFKNPQFAKERSKEILDEMVRQGHTSAKEAETSFADFWDNFDWSRSATTTAFFERQDQAPYFSEYIRGLLDEQLFGAWDIYRDGLSVYTTLDLEHQRIADRVMAKHVAYVDGLVSQRDEGTSRIARDGFLPVVDLLALGYDMGDFRSGRERSVNNARQLYLDRINPVLDALALMLYLPEVKTATQTAHQMRMDEARRTEVEGALISIESTTGRIVAMVGGRKWESTDQFNRATLARVQPGSSFKPLYYSLAIESKKATMGTMLLDAPVQYTNPDGTYYRPLNYVGQWEGPVPLWWALADSKNVPSVKVFDMVGVEPVIDWSSNLLGINDPRDRELAFRPPHGYPIALGVAAVSPLQMARAYATFPNGGEAVEPLAIVRIVDRDGKVILEPEKTARLGRSARNARLMSPQTAAIMTEILERAVQRGTLSGARYRARELGADISPDWGDRPIAGKTGTTQNWVAAWTVGFTAQYTTAIWFGFDQGARSMGRPVTGATAVAPAWAEYMDAVHQGEPIRAFPEPERGLVRQRVDSVTGLLPTEYCPETEVLTFIEGTVPRVLCDLHQYEERQTQAVIDRMNPFIDFRTELPPDIFESFLEEESGTTGAGRSPLAD